MNKENIPMILFFVGLIFIIIGIVFNGNLSDDKKLEYTFINDILIENGYSYDCGGDDCSIAVVDGEIEHRWVLYSSDKHFENVQVELFKMNSANEATDFFKNYHSSAEKEIKNHLSYSTSKYVIGEFADTKYMYLVKEGEYLLVIEGDFSSEMETKLIIDKLDF